MLKAALCLASKGFTDSGTALHYNQGQNLWAGIQQLEWVRKIGMGRKG